MIAGGTLSGHFDLRVYDAATGRLTKLRSFDNLITNNGLIRYCQPYSSNTFLRVQVCVGKGTAAPQPTDTSLADYFASSSNSDEMKGKLVAPEAPDWISSSRVTLRFNAGTFNGDVITEIGICQSDNRNNLWCRALILDDYGDPSSITILANEYLDVTYTLNYHPILTDTPFQFVMNGTTYSCVARPAFINDQAFSSTGSNLFAPSTIIDAVYNIQTLGEITGEPVYSTGGKQTVSSQEASYKGYSTESPFSYTCTYTLPLTLGNFSNGGIGAMLLRGAYNYGIIGYTQISITPKIPKDPNTEMTFTLSRTVSRWLS